MKKITMIFGMMMIAGTMTLPAFAVQEKPADTSERLMVARNYEPCCPEYYQQQAKESRTEAKAVAVTDPGAQELPWAALRN